MRYIAVGLLPAVLAVGVCCCLGSLALTVVLASPTISAERIEGEWVLLGDLFSFCNERDSYPARLSLRPDGVYVGTPTSRWPEGRYVVLPFNRIVIEGRGGWEHYSLGIRRVGQTDTLRFSSWACRVDYLGRRG